jgi:hypothetical protein
MTVPPKGYATSVNVSFTKGGGIYKKSVLCKLTHADLLRIPVEQGKITSAPAAERHRDSPGNVTFCSHLSDGSLPGSLHPLPDIAAG